MSPVSPVSRRARVVARPRVLAFGRAVWSPPPSFLALAVRTANAGRDSLCGVAAVRVEHGLVVETFAGAVRPKARFLAPTQGAAPRWKDLEAAPAFRETWTTLRRLATGVEFVAAHDVVTTAAVLDACCDRDALPRFDARWEGTAALARRVWGIDAPLDATARELGIAVADDRDSLDADAAACAEIVLRAWAA